jgi:cyclase
VITRRIIPCLDIKDGRTVKGINFENLVDAGDPVELASYYAKQGADEIVFLDISATSEKRKTLTALTKEIARNIDVPFTIGGGVSSVRDVATLLNAGADKISINSAVVKNPGLITQLALEFGSQCITVAIDARKVNSSWIVFTHGGKVATNKELVSWAVECADAGAGEILFTSMDHDGTQQGFAVNELLTLHERVNIPVIASGGAGKKEHFLQALQEGKADAVLAASLFHFGKLRIPELKQFLLDKQIPIRP